MYDMCIWCESQEMSDGTTSRQVGRTQGGVRWETSSRAWRRKRGVTWVPQGLRRKVEGLQLTVFYIRVPIYTVCSTGTSCFNKKSSYVRGGLNLTTSLILTPSTLIESIRIEREGFKNCATRKHLQE